LVKEEKAMQTFDFVSGTILGTVVSGGRYMLVVDHLAILAEKIAALTTVLGEKELKIIELEKDCERMRNIIIDLRATQLWSQEQYDLVQEENERLREALKELAKYKVDPLTPIVSDTLLAVAKFAQAALKQTEPSNVGLGTGPDGKCVLSFTQIKQTEGGGE
jgi:hypothetical protein